MLSLYIENKLDDEDKFFVENHFKACSDCYNKYLEMKEIITNLHFEYEKLLNEFEKLETTQMFNIREYENFYKNISPYIDDELCYDDSIKFRKYLLKSKSARTELATAYSLKSNIKNSIAKYKDALNINYSKKIIKKLQEENKDSFENIYKRAAIVLGFMFTSLVFISLYLGFSYINKAYAIQPTKENVVQTMQFSSEDDLVEFSFDENNQPLLTLK